MGYIHSILLLLLAFAITKTDNEICVDLIELNHIRTKTSQFDQIIFWKEYSAAGLNKSEFRAVGFIVLDDDSRIRNYIIKRNGWYKVKYTHRIVDNINNETTMVAKYFRESWSQDDPERDSVRKHWGGNPPELFNKNR